MNKLRLISPFVTMTLKLLYLAPNPGVGDSTISGNSNGFMDGKYDSRNLHTMPDRFM